MSSCPATRGLGALLLAVALSAGCAGFRVRGRVVRSSGGPGDAGDEPDEHGLPLASARVTLECPEDLPDAARQARLRVESDLDGHFHGGGRAPVPLACDLRVEADGYVPGLFRVADVCTLRAAGRRDACSAATVRASLPPVH